MSGKPRTGLLLIVPAVTTRRVQEGHMVLYHAICDIVDPMLGT